jgi:hypothetical protein
MKKKIITIALVLFRLTSFSQTPSVGKVNLGILTSFEGYTGAGAVTAASGTVWTGDVGSNVGAITGAYVGDTYNADTVTAHSRLDLFRLYIHLNDLFVDYPNTHAPAFGAGERLSPGVYSIASAGSIGQTLTLDGGGDPEAFFVIKYYGALTVGARAVVNLAGGTKSCNVFFIAQGAISVAANANIKGTLFSKIGAVGLGANVVLEGRMLSMEGAITAGVNSIVNPPPGTSTIPIFCETDCSPAPAVDVLGVLSNYALFTSFGAVPNTSTSCINGDIGTDGGGTISGYTASSIVIGNYYTADANTDQAKIDLDNAYIALMALPNTVTTHTPAFGTGETVTAGVYSIAAAGSLSGTIFLDAQNDPDAIFVFKFGGAFTVAAESKMILSNGARRCNVFFIGGANVATGAISIGAGSTLKGTFISHGGACGSGADLFLAGRQLSTAGAVNTYSGIIYNNPECVTSTPIGVVVPIELLSFTSKCINQNIELNWRTASEINNAYFLTERSIDGINWQRVTKVNGAGNSTSIKNYSYTDIRKYKNNSYYRLKQTDFNGEFKYSNIIEITKCKNERNELAIYPNPVNETLNLSNEGDKSQILSTSIYNELGEMVYYSEFYQSRIVFENKLSGMYFLHVNTTSKNIIKKFIVVD